MKEIWSVIVGYETYEVSNLGNVRSLNYRNRGYVQTLVPKINNSGRLWVELRKDGKRKQMLIHRLVGEAFIPNPRNLPQINHKDENPKNNNVSNLEWCTGKYNVRYFVNRHPEFARNRKSTEKYCRRLNKPVIQIDRNGVIVKQWEDARTVVNETGYNQWSITQCCDGKRRTAYGFRWQYVI